MTKPRARSVISVTKSNDLWEDILSLAVKFLVVNAQISKTRVDIFCRHVDHIRRARCPKINYIVRYQEITR